MSRQNIQLFSREFLIDLRLIIEDFVLFAVVLLLFRAMQLLVDSLAFEANIKGLVDLIDECAKLALLSLLGVSIFLRFLRRTLVTRA